MPRPGRDEGGTAYVFDPKTGSIQPAYYDASGKIISQADIDASLKANPQASKGGYEGVGTPASPGPGGTTNYGTALSPDDAAAYAPKPAAAPIGDYSTFLGIYGLPADVQSKVNSIFQSTTDVNQATQLALAYVRGTPWYAQTYPGIQEGIARGVISNEADYRSYLNNTNILAKQYLGRDISASEIGDFLKQGYGVDRISRIYQGGALVKANGNDWNYLTGAFDENGPLTAEESAAVGQEQAGIDTLLGQKVQRRLDLAKQRMAGVFSGTVATPSLSLAGGRLSAPSLGGGAAPDIAA